MAASRWGLHPFTYPRLWLAVWALGWLLCIVLSLMRNPPMPEGIPNADKVLHALAYALLSAWAALLFATVRTRTWAALSLVALGVAMEIAQGEWTTYRSMDAWDGVADALGVLLGQGLALTPAATALLRLERRRRAPGQHGT